MQKLALIILDGFGLRKEKRGNAVKLAKIPNLNKIQRMYSSTVLQASGEAVGLPEGTMGNSEVGHLTIGAGRIIDSDYLKINKAIKNGSFYRNKVLLSAFKHAKNKKLHLMGLVSDAGVHAHINHLFALLELAKRQGLKNVYIHAFLDGRDTPPKSAGEYLKQIQQKIKQLGVGEIATIMGRFYAMDRDNRWNREHQAYASMVNGEGRKILDLWKALRTAYNNGETDEFVLPTIISEKGCVEEGDTVVFFNFRSDRARELTKAFVFGKFKHFHRKKLLDLRFVALTQYEKKIKVPVVFPPEFPKNTLGKIISKAGLRQLRVAETEKWAHVTYFFNGLCEQIFRREERIHVYSRKVKTYDKTPMMKVKQITAKLLKNKNKYDFFVVNFANADMLGHTGKVKETVKSIEVMDSCLGEIVEKFPGILVITADHGNAEDLTPKWNTSHTTNPVLLLITSGKVKLRTGGLQDVAPTILDLMEIRQPKEMKGRSLLSRKN